MKTLIYKIKNKLFYISKEGKKIKKPSYEDLVEYKNFTKSENNKFALSFGAGRSGQNWFTKIFNNHSNWIGTCERFADYEAFYRYISFYNLPVNKEGIFKLFELASKRDMAKFQNTFIASPYLSFGVRELFQRLNPDYLFFHLRNPIQSVQSLYMKNWYQNSHNFELNVPLIDFSVGLHRSLSRIVPNNEFLKEWPQLSRIGKITWFWAIINKAIYDDFNQIEDAEKFYVKLEDVNQNYDVYEILSDKFNFENKLIKREFNNIINKAPNKGPSIKYEYSEWNNIEKKEFENIIERFFPFYDSIKTNF